jgi:hypothetical protein
MKGNDELMKNYSYLILFICVISLAFFTMNTVFAEYDEYQVLDVTVEEGDTLWGIASAHNQNVGLSIQDYIYKIRSLNDMDSVIIYPGQTIQIITNQKS